MPFHQQVISFPTPKRGLFDATHDVARVVAGSGIDTGLCHLFLQHTSASLVIQENADPSVLRDLGRFFEDLVPESRAWEHDDEGPDDMPAHVKSVLTKTQETIPIREGRLALGTWQAVYVWEHRARPHARSLVVTIWGD